MNEIIKNAFAAAQSKVSAKADADAQIKAIELARELSEGQIYVNQMVDGLKLVLGAIPQIEPDYINGQEASYDKILTTDHLWSAIVNVKDGYIVITWLGFPNNFLRMDEKMPGDATTLAALKAGVETLGGQLIAARLWDKTYWRDAKLQVRFSAKDL